MAKADKSKKESSRGKEATATQETGPLPLFYKKPEPLDASKHIKLGMKENFGTGFTKEINAVPINMIEMPQICHYYPIAFSPDEFATPVALLGLRDQENLFVNDNGEWLEGAYIPAYIRRYPFIFSETQQQDQLTLCVDMDSDFVGDDFPIKFFNDDKKPTEFAENALNFCKSYHSAAIQTQALSKALVEADLLIDRQAEIRIAEDKKITFSGFRIIDEEKLAKLDDKTFLEWRQKGWLPFIYAHLFSGAQWQRLTTLIRRRMADA